jgi:hypothetical protein
MATNSTRPSLARLAKQIVVQHRRCQAATDTFLKSALECGRLLQQAKAAVHHGEWMTWVENHCSFNIRQAQRYIRLYEHKGEIEEKMRLRESHLVSLIEALDLIREPQEVEVMVQTLASPPDVRPTVDQRVVTTGTRQDEGEEDEEGERDDEPSPREDSLVIVPRALMGKHKLMLPYDDPAQIARSLYLGFYDDDRPGADWDRFSAEVAKLDRNRPHPSEIQPPAQAPVPLYNH